MLRLATAWCVHFRSWVVRSQRVANDGAGSDGGACDLARAFATGTGVVTGLLNPFSAFEPILFEPGLSCQILRPPVRGS